MTVIVDNILYLQHVAISVGNLEEAINWYRDVFGFEVVSCEEHREITSKVATLALPSVRLEVFQHAHSRALPQIRTLPQTDIQEQGMKHFCIGTKNLENTIDMLREKGVEIVAGPDVFEGTPFIYIRDNSGILIEIMELHNTQ